MKIYRLAPALGFAITLFLSACGGGDSGGSSNSSSNGNAASSVALSSGTITAFGSVFVNGREYSTAGARVIDDDTGAASTSTAGLEVGEVVEMKTTGGPAPRASELHVDPLARGYVDASDTTAGTLTVMGQTIQISSATAFSDHRACVTAATNPCTAITAQSGLTTTTGSGASAVPGSYVTVHGYLFAAGGSGTTTNIVATLVAVGDAPATAAAPAQFKVEGTVTAAAGASLTIGALSVDLSSAVCHVAGTTTACNGAFNVGQVVSAYAAAAPVLPANTFAATGARLRPTLLVSAPGVSVEIGGAVSAVTLSPASFVLRGINIDASNLPAGTSLPAVGDIVTVLGTVASNGASVSATAVTVLRAAQSATYAFEGDVDPASIVQGPTADTYVVTVLGQPITVTAATRLADRSTRTWASVNPTSNPLNITSFVSYLEASASQHLVIQTEADASGNLAAISLTIVPVSSVAGVAGVVDATPAPINSTVKGTPTSFGVHGLAVSADPDSVLQLRGLTPATVASGDEVLVLGTYTSSSTLMVTAPPSATNVVIDRGKPKRRDCDQFSPQM